MSMKRRKRRRKPNQDSKRADQITINGETRNTANPAETQVEPNLRIFRVLSRRPPVANRPSQVPRLPLGPTGARIPATRSLLWLKWWRLTPAREPMLACVI